MAKHEYNNETEPTALSVRHRVSIIWIIPVIAMQLLGLSRLLMVLTMLAAESFDPKLMWDKMERQNG